MLDLLALEDANIKRLPQFRNNKGKPVHVVPEGEKPGSDWSPERWLQAVVGELGEYANFRKKFDRGDISEELFKEVASKELADVIIYLSILAYQLNISLDTAICSKFNETSVKVGSTIELYGDDWRYRIDPQSGKRMSIQMAQDIAGAIRNGTYELLYENWGCIPCTNCKGPLKIHRFEYKKFNILCICGTVTKIYDGKVSQE